MAGSFACLRYHIVFSTKDRQPLLMHDVRPRLFEYIGGILRNRNGQLLAAGGTSNHVHLFASLPRDRSLSDVLRDIKSNSSRWLEKPVASEMRHVRPSMSVRVSALSARVAGGAVAARGVPVSSARRGGAFV
jgi:REP element-mobilizing transposase RayT